MGHERLPLQPGIRAVLVALLGVIASLSLLASPASAHAQVQSSMPQPGARLERSPELVSILFDEKVTATAGGIRVYNALAKRIGAPPTKSAGTAMTLKLPTLADGAYVVVWQAVSADGHPVRGSFTFQVGDGDQAALASFGESELSNAATDPVVQELMRVLRFLLFASMTLLIAAVTWRITHLPLPATRAFKWAGIVAPAVALASLVVDGPYGRGEGLAAVGPQLFGESLAKITVRALLGVGLVCFLASRLLRRIDAPKVGLFGVLVLLASFTGATGHAVASSNPVLPVLTTSIHVVAASTWAGGLFLLVVANRQEIPIDLRRWSSLAQVAVIAIVLTGAAHAVRQVGSLNAAMTTAYGRLLIVKLLVVMVLLMLGGSQRRRLSSVQYRVVATEAVFAAIVVAMSTVLSSMVPARASESRPTSIRVQTKSTRSDVTIDPARRGTNVIHIYVFGLDGVTLPIDDANFELTHLATGTTIEVDPFKAGRGHEEARGVQLPFTGTWQLETRLYLSEFEVEQSTSTFEVR